MGGYLWVANNHIQGNTSALQRVDTWLWVWSGVALSACAWIGGGGGCGVTDRTLVVRGFPRHCYAPHPIGFTQIPA